MLKAEVVYTTGSTGFRAKWLLRVSLMSVKEHQILKSQMPCPIFKTDSNPAHENASKICLMFLFYFYGLGLCLSKRITFCTSSSIFRVVASQGSQGKIRESFLVREKSGKKSGNRPFSLENAFCAFSSLSPKTWCDVLYPYNI